MKFFTFLVFRQVYTCTHHTQRIFNYTKNDDEKEYILFNERITARLIKIILFDSGTGRPYEFQKLGMRVSVFSSQNYLDDQGNLQNTPDDLWQQAGHDKDGNPIYTTSKDDGCLPGDISWPHVPSDKAPIIN